MPSIVYDLDTEFCGGDYDGMTVAEVIAEDRKYVIGAWKNGTRFSDDVIAALGFKRTATRILSPEEVAERRKNEAESRKTKKSQDSTVEALLEEIEKEGKVSRGEVEEGAKRARMDYEEEEEEEEFGGYDRDDDEDSSDEDAEDEF